MRQFELQAFTVQIMLENILESDRKSNIESTETIACLRDAITTLNAAALTKEKLSITEDLIKLSQEFSADAPSMDLTELVCYQNDFREILDKLNHK